MLPGTALVLWSLFLRAQCDGQDDTLEMLQTSFYWKGCSDAVVKTEYGVYHWGYMGIMEKNLDISISEWGIYWGFFMFTHCAFLKLGGWP